jgi:hypothetical protein
MKKNEKKIATIGPYDVVRTTLTDGKDGVKIRIMPPIVLTLKPGK